MADHSPLDNITDLRDEELPAIAALPGDMCGIAKVVAPVVANERLAVRVVLAIAHAFRGGHVYFRSLDEIFLKARDRRIRSEYDGGGISGPQLARKYRISDRRLWEILGTGDE